MNETVAIIQLIQTDGLGARTLRRLLERLSQEGRSVADIVAAPPEELADVYGVRPTVAMSVSAGARKPRRFMKCLRRRRLMS